MTASVTDSSTLRARTVSPPVTGLTESPIAIEDYPSVTDVTDASPFRTRTSEPPVTRCDQCGRVIAEGEPLHRGDRLEHDNTLCWECHPPDRLHKKYQWWDHWRRHVCRGCGREFTAGTQTTYRQAGGPARAWCREWCRNQHGTDRARSRRATRRGDTSRDCETCGRSFTPPRSDGRYCSGACRQRAYRQRQAKP